MGYVLCSLRVNVFFFCYKISYSALHTNSRDLKKKRFFVLQFSLLGYSRVIYYRHIVGYERVVVFHVLTSRGIFLSKQFTILFLPPKSPCPIYIYRITNNKIVITSVVRCQWKSRYELVYVRFIQQARHINIYVCVYICVCMCCIYARTQALTFLLHRLYIYMYVYVKKK